MMLGLGLSLWRSGGASAPPEITLAFNSLDTGSEPYALTTTVSGMTAAGTLYWLGDDNATRTAEQVEAGGAVSGSYAVNENGEGVGEIDLSGLGSGTHYLHLVVKQGSTYSNVVDQEIEIPAAFAISGADSSYTYDDGVDVWRIIRVTSSKDLTVTGSGTVAGVLVGAGGAGVYTHGSAGGGGGGGQVLEISGMALTAGTYPVVIGSPSGGATSESSTFNSLTALGGGRGGFSGAGSTGGSGGGAGGSSSSAAGGAASGTYSNAGGANYPAAGADRASGGGGGAGAVGAAGAYRDGGNGGAGRSVSKPDGAITLGGGGGGAARYSGGAGTGGSGGGGNGSVGGLATAGAANTGGGGGGAGQDVSGTNAYSDTSSVSALGGSGVLWLWFVES